MAEWHTKPMSGPTVRFDFDRTFTPGEMERVRKGFVPEEMEEKWYIVFRGDKLDFHRSWSGDHIYSMEIDDAGRVTGVIAARDPASYTDENREHDRSLVRSLLDTYVLRRLSTN